MCIRDSQLDYNTDFVTPFGSFVQAYEERNPKNNNTPRTIDAIYLRPTSDMQRGHEVINLATGQVVVRPRVTKIPITERVIKTVEEVAERQKMKSLKVTGRNKTLILPAEWIAGVDHNLQNEDPEEDDGDHNDWVCLLYTSPSPRDGATSRMPSSA